MRDSFSAPGAKFWAFDLHVHTPSSHDYKDKSTTAEQIVDAALSAGLDAIAITDHNQVDFIDQVRLAAQNTPLVVFPGVEVSTAGGHLIAILDLDEPVSTLEDLLRDSGIDRDRFGDPQAVGHDIREVISCTAKLGGVAIAAHIDHDTGFLSRRVEGPLQADVHNHPGLSAIEITKTEDHPLWLKGGHPDYSHLRRPRACVQGSDAHHPSDIGLKRTFIKMGRPSLRGLKLAFDDPEVNVCFSDDLPGLVFPQILSLEVSRGFLAQHKIEFNPGLNCLVGGKGTGKSTVIEFVRFALGQVSELDVIAEDTRWKVHELAEPGATITVTLQDAEGNIYRIFRQYDGTHNPTSVVRLLSEGDSEVIADIDVPQFFKIHAYSQGEATIIARTPLSQLQLIDKHIDLTEENDRLSRVRDLLAGSHDTLLNIDRQLSQYDRLSKRVATLGEQINVKQGRLRSLEEAQENPILVDHDVWESEKRYLSDVVSELDKIVERFNKAFEEIDLAAILGEPPERVLNQDAVNYAYAEVRKIPATIEGTKRQLVADLQKVKERLSLDLQPWKQSYEQHRQAYDELQKELSGTDSQQLASEIERLRKQETDTGAKLRELNALKERQDTLIEERRAWLDELEDIRLRKHAKRERQIQTIREEIGNIIGIGLKESGNREDYSARLRQHLRGSNTHATVIKDIVESLSPSALVALVRAKDVDGLDWASNIGEDWSRRVVDHLSTKPEALFEVEEIVCEDLLDVRLRVAPDVYRPLHKLSAGQKATVIILLALIDGTHPVLFDQPEDSLDTSFIYQEVVRILRQAKSKRQFILATHNPNISVSSHLDQGIILDVDETAQQALIRGAGSIDDKETRSLLVLYLEGGDKAFGVRGRKYRLPGWQNSGTI